MTRLELPHGVEERLQSFDIRLGVRLQFPEDGPTNIDVPRAPHVFFCTDIFLIQPNEAMTRTQTSLDVTENDALRLPMVFIPYENETVSAIHLRDVMVMLGHAVTTGRSDEAWKFIGTQRSVSDTVMSYQKVARDILWPPLDAVIACRPSSYDTRPSRNVIFTFHQTLIPVIRPDSSAHVRNEGTYQSELKVGVGVTLYVAADAWIQIPWWLNYRSNSPRLNTIPQWAREPTR